MQFKHMEQQQEEFRSIPGYEGLYEVSNFGNVKSLGNNRTRKEKILKPVLVGLIGWQYYSVTLCKDGKSRHLNIHILVVMAFLGHVPDGTLKIVVDHIDNNRLNNHVSNLQLITQRENLSKDKKNGTSKYTGVYWGKAKNKWVSKITINGILKHLGLFTSEEDAAEVYQEALKMYHEGDLSFTKIRIPSSKYKGVSWHKATNKWQSQIQINGKKKHLGLFKTEEEAYDVYCKQKMNAE
jgi:hypothetical protein